MNGTKLRSAQNGSKTLSKAAIKRRVNRISRDLEAISGQAESGDARAATILVGLTLEATLRLERVVNRQSHLVSGVGSVLSAWPVAASRDATRQAKLHGMFEKVGLGRFTGFISDNQVVSRPTPARAIVYSAVTGIHDQKMIGLRARAGVEQYCKRKAHAEMQALLKDPRPYRAAIFNEDYLARHYLNVLRLKPLTAATIDDWFTCVKSLIMIRYRGFPESEPVLRQMGKHRESRAKAGSRAVESNIRDGIFKRLKVTFGNMVKAAVQEGRQQSTLLLPEAWLKSAGLLSLLLNTTLGLPPPMRRHPYPKERKPQMTNPSHPCLPAKPLPSPSLLRLFVPPGRSTQTARR
jgi:hypothetical protein